MSVLLLTTWILLSEATASAQTAKTAQCPGFSVQAKYDYYKAYQIRSRTASCLIVRRVIGKFLRNGPKVGSQQAHGWRCVTSGPGKKSHCDRNGRRFKFKWSIAVERIQSEPRQSAGCGRVRLNNPEISFRVYMRVQNVSCRHAVRVAESSLFGQGGPPIDGWTCPSTSSVRGRCHKGMQRLAYAAKRKHIPPFTRGHRPARDPMQ